MTFSVRDLMLDVLPENVADTYELRLCQPVTDVGPPPKPRPRPHPRPEPKPECMPVTTIGTAGPSEVTIELASLDVMREQLHQALRC